MVTIVAKSAESGISHGSGFFVSQEGYILTAAHVVVGRSLVVKTYDGRFYEAQHIKTDRELDLALIKAISSTEKFTEVGIGDSSAVEKGDRILVIGTPISGEYEYTSVTGIISGIDRHRGLLQLSIPTYQGHSGSPVFDIQGRASHRCDNYGAYGHESSACRQREQASTSRNHPGSRKYRIGSTHQLC